MYFTYFSDYFENFTNPNLYKMSSEVPNPDIDDVDDPNYKPPPQKSIEEILATDQEDESLRRYKETLLGGAAAGTEIIVGEWIIRFHRY